LKSPISWQLDIPIATKKPVGIFPGFGMGVDSHPNWMCVK